jgi:hypothetical protein
MNIGFAGCSYTAGAELAKPNEERYSAIVCNSLMAHEINIAENNLSNEVICKRTWETVNLVDVDFMVVQISSFLRFSFPYDNKIVSINPYRRQKYDYDLVGKIVYSKESDYRYWYELTRWKTVSLHHYLNVKHINHMFVFMLEDDVKMFFEDDTIEQSFIKQCERTSLMGFVEKNGYGFFKGKHPSELGHYHIAHDLILPEILRQKDLV